VVLFSVATYVRYRAAALSAFDVDLRNNLETLRAALMEELGDVRQRPIPGAEESIRDPLRYAAGRTLEDFRLNGLFAEIRLGRDAETLLARLPGAGVEADQTLIPERDWRSAAAASRRSRRRESLARSRSSSRTRRAWSTRLSVRSAGR
jgi:hypothetical protein